MKVVPSAPKSCKDIPFCGHPVNLELDLPPNPFTQPSTDKIVHNMNFWGEIPNKQAQKQILPTKAHLQTPKNLTPASTVRQTGSPDWSEPDWSHLHCQLVRQVRSPLALKPLKMHCNRIQMQCICEIQIQCMCGMQIKYK